MTAPAVFDQRECDGVVSLRTDRPSPEQTENVRYAAMICPSRAITVTEELPRGAAGTVCGDASVRTWQSGFPDSDVHANSIKAQEAGLYP
jgi:hypothetical protein